MSFQDALAQQPDWVVYWVNWMTLIFGVSFVAFLFSRHTRGAALAVFLAYTAGVLMLFWLYAELGYVRLLGLPHVLFWTPLAIYLIWRLRDRQIPTPLRLLMGVLLATVVISLGFDYTDVARYLLGEREPLVMAAGSQ